MSDVRHLAADTTADRLADAGVLGVQPAYLDTLPRWVSGRVLGSVGLLVPISMPDGAIVVHLRRTGASGANRGRFTRAVTKREPREGSAP